MLRDYNHDSTSTVEKRVTHTHGHACDSTDQQQVILTCGTMLATMSRAGTLTVGNTQLTARHRNLANKQNRCKE